MSSIYKEEILEHYQDPQNFGKLSEFTISSRQTNPFCGDDIELFIKLHKVHNVYKVQDISFTGRGCAISIAAASLLTEYAKGKVVKSLHRFGKKDMLSLLGIELSETRMKCGLLALATMQDCLNV